MGLNSGVLEVSYETVDVTGLTNANNEPWDPAANTGLDDARSVSIVGYENGETYTVEWDHLQQAFVFATIADGTDPGAGTDVGEVRVRVEGRR